jgi:hypothetical protein
MSLLFYRRIDGPACAALEKIFHDLGLDGELEIFPTLRSLHQRLRRSCYDVSSVLLCISSTKELETILEAKERYMGLRILVFPTNRDAEALKRIHELYPRYVCTGDGEYGDLREVLRKIYDNPASKDQGTDSGSI